MRLKQMRLKQMRLRDLYSIVYIYIYTYVCMYIYSIWQPYETDFLLCPFIPEGLQS